MSASNVKNRSIANGPLQAVWPI